MNQPICPKLTPPRFSETSAVADLCLGWFWGPDYTFSHIPGVTDVTVGYAGGIAPWPTYRNIQDYTEAVRIEYNPSIISYEQLLEEFMKELGGPPSYSRSRQYRSAVLYHTPQQQATAERFLTAYARQRKLTKMHIDLEPATNFYRAEEYHQKYYENNNVY